MVAHSDSSSNGASIPSGSNGFNGTNGTHHAYTHTNQDAARSGAPIAIAIVGMACRFGGDVDSPSKLWDLCAAGKDGWSPIPEQRFDVKSLYHEDKNRIGRVRSKPASHLWPAALAPSPFAPMHVSSASANGPKP